MTTNPHPDCPICVAMYGAQGKRLGEVIRRLMQIEATHCLCPHENHPVYAQHPHTGRSAGCLGFGTCPSEEGYGQV
jgi:hypothetical protein